MLTTVLFVPDVRVCERGDDILSRQLTDPLVYKDAWVQSFSVQNTHTKHTEPLTSTRLGCRGHIPSNILVGDVNANIPQINIITYFKFSTSEFTKICHFEITEQKKFRRGCTASSPDETLPLVGKGCWKPTVLPTPHPLQRFVPPPNIELASTPMYRAHYGHNHISVLKTNHNPNPNLSLLMDVVVDF